MSDEKKYLDSNGLIRLVANVIAKLNGKSDSSHTHNDLYYTESEIDSKISTLNSSISSKADASDLTSGNITVAEAEHAGSAITSDTATHAVSSESATSAIKDSKGNVIADTYQTIANATSQHNALQSAIDGKANASHSHSAATTSAAGFMSAADKEKLDGIAAGANNYTYTLPSAGSSLGGVKSGGDVTISSGVITVNDDSHNHVISNVDGLQSALDAKADASHSHNDLYYTEDEIDATVAELESAISGKAASSHSHSDATTSASGFMSASDKSKLAGIATGAEVNQNAFANVVVGSTTIAADAKSDSLTIAAGTGISVTGDATNDKVTITNSGVRSIATGSSNGTISVNTNGTSANVAVKGLGSAAYTASTAYDAAGAASTALAEAKSYADSAASSAATTVKNDLLNGAGAAYDTLKELGDLIDDNKDAIEALNDIAAGKADSGHTHSNYASTVTTTGSGNAITAISQSGNTITATKGASFATSDHTHSAYVNQNAFSSVKVGDTTVAADSATDTLTLIAGSNVTLTPDSTNDSVTIAAKDTVYTHPSYTSKSNGLYKITVDGTGHVSGTAAVAKSDITALGIPAQDTTYSAATTSAAGLMSTADKTKLNGIATGAEVNQNAFSNVTVGSTTIAADGKTDTLTLVAGSNVTLTPDATNDKITIAATDTVYTHPTTAGNKHIPSGGSSGQILRWSADGTAAWGADNNTTYSAGTGISLSGTTFSNSGVRSISSGSTNGTISVNTNGTAAEVAVKGLGSAAYTASSAYAAASHTHTVSQISDLTATAAELNKLDGVTATTTELNYVDGVTSNIQSQLDSKAASGHTHSNYASTVSTTGSGNAITAISQSGNTITATKGSTFSLSNHTHNYAGSSSAGGVANSAAKLETARTISLAGDASGAVSFDGSGDASIAATVLSMHGITATSEDGIAYTATVDGITSLTAGVSFIMIPSRNSASTTPTLNVNGLGAKGLRMRGSSATGTAMAASVAAWLAVNRPVQITYNGIFWVAEVTRPAASDLSGTVPITAGGTGASDAATALTNFGLTATVTELNYTDGVTSNIQTQLDTKANKADIATTATLGQSNSAAVYVKISDFGAWGTGAWHQKGFSMLITSRAGEMVWLAVSSDDSNTNAKAIRLLNTYSKIVAVYYSASESAVYVKANAWCNNINAHILSNVNGDYVPTVAQASALASDAVEINIVEFGVTSSGLAVGDSSVALALGGSADRPTYNSNDLALKSDVDAAKEEILASVVKVYTGTTAPASDTGEDGDLYLVVE